MAESAKALTLSIIIPAYNEEHYLRQCLQAIAKQTVKPDEVIVVDNDSKDRTREIAESFDFVTLLQEKKKGVTFARDRGYDAAQSDLIGRIDADTVLHPDWVAEVKELFEQNPTMSAVSGPTGFYDLPFRKFSLLLTKVIRTFLYYAGAKEERYLFGSNMALRRSSWEAVRNFVCRDFSIHEDNDLAIHLEHNGFNVRYNNGIVADISARRADMALRDAWKYAKMEFHTFKQHGIISLASIFAAITLLFFFPLVRFLRMTFDLETRHFSLRRLRHFRPDKRKLPMD